MTANASLFNYSISVELTWKPYYGTEILIDIARVSMWST